MGKVGSKQNSIQLLLFEKNQRNVKNWRSWTSKFGCNLRFPNSIKITMFRQVSERLAALSNATHSGIAKPRFISQKRNTYFEFVKANTFTHLDISLPSESGNAVHISIPISPCTSPERVPQRQVVSTRLGLLFRNRKKRVFGYCWHFWWPSAGRLGFIPSAIKI